ncbi:hypothetical protein WICMUC_001062 [Wickerhamomyces mucosus]|uniref:Ribosomal protein L9 domain-containing protein n=1 Tax=Wickerhamomyces mucosus TaxID=1378264 RepID=A0A9P8PVQ8_9ASCO|nr:hypothetical protein WICMUC_001062 [Wickerhamomyces mucosus]
MNSIIRHHVWKRIPLVRYSSRTKRENRIQVQLLRDFEQYGVKGEIIEVLPGLMRNTLYPNNGACYIIPKKNLGPRIPVVKREKQVDTITQQVNEVSKTEIKVQEKDVKEQKPKSPISIKGLLFTKQDNTTNENSIEASTNDYSLIALDIKLGDQVALNLSEKLNKAQVVSQILKLTGIKISSSDLSIQYGKVFVDEITEAGKYRLIISPEFSNGERITKALIVQ